jgi:hypothetical protein
MINVLVKFSLNKEIHLIRYESIIEFISKGDKSKTFIVTEKKEYMIMLNYRSIMSQIEDGLKKAKCHKWPFMIIDLTLIQSGDDRPWWADVVLKKNIEDV